MKPQEQPPPPIQLSFDQIDDLIYDARIGELDTLRADIASLSKQYSCSEADVVSSTIDTEDGSEGGTGSCLLHFPAANGNIGMAMNARLYLFSVSKLTGKNKSEIVSSLLEILNSAPESSSFIINHKNNSGNTPLHWAALNTHLDCVKALVAAGANISAKNHAGHDAVFLAERTVWSTGAAERGEQQKRQDDAGEEDDLGENSPGRAVVEWLLGCDKGISLESSAGITHSAGESMDVSQ